ncbi:MAG: thymidylate kinase [Bacilli bacterium]|nr:thymidylate kinase [Bacilli bacterium]
MRGKLIVIEGTDCSGKETQSNLLIEKLKNDGVRIEKFSFPNYNSPTGKIIGGPYLGKSYICEGWFSEGAPNVDPKVSALYYAADRLYNIDKINFLLEHGVNVILDRYVYSNMAHQGGKLSGDERNSMYEWLFNLEFNLLSLPKPDISVFLHMPFECSVTLKKNRPEELDQNESDMNHLINAEEAYIDIANKYGFYTIECNIGDRIRTIDEINVDLYNYVSDRIKVD